MLKDAGWVEGKNWINEYHIPGMPNKSELGYADYTLMGDDDEILSMDWKESEIESDDLKNYKAKAEYYVRQHQDHTVISKLKHNKPLTGEDVAALENILWSEVGTKQEYEAEYGEKPLAEFVREIVGLDMNAAKETFSEYLNETNLDSRQISSFIENGKAHI